MSGPKKFGFTRIKTHARDLRKRSTESEKLLWKKLRNRRLSGFKFLRQHPILYQGNLIRLNYFIADFYCDEKKTVIEIDGPIHDRTIEYDQFRDSKMRELGIHTLRIKNEELKNMEKVLIRILSFLNEIN